MYIYTDIGVKRAERGKKMPFSRLLLKINFAVSEKVCTFVAENH